ncbi:MAG: protein-disulfide reductase DsbD domain-containing protein, partial [Candidatus Binatia bacterium]
FWDEAAGGFYMSADDQEGRLLVRPKSPTDGATPSGNSVAVRALAKLAARTGDERFRQGAQATIVAFSGQIRRQPTAFAYLLLGADELLHGEVGPLAYGAGGAVRVEASEGDLGGGPRELEVALEIAPGWHVQASRPLQENLIATRLDLAEGETKAALGAIVYPEPELVRLGFQKEPLAVYQGRATIRAALTPDSSALASRLALTIQACDDRKCLRPETLLLGVAAPSRGRSLAPRQAGLLSPTILVVSGAAVAFGAAGAAWWVWKRPARSASSASDLP